MVICYLPLQLALRPSTRSGLFLKERLTTWVPKSWPKGFVACHISFGPIGTTRKPHESLEVASSPALGHTTAPVSFGRCSSNLLLTWLQCLLYAARKNGSSESFVVPDYILKGRRDTWTFLTTIARGRLSCVTPKRQNAKTSEIRLPLGNRISRGETSF